MTLQKNSKFTMSFGCTVIEYEYSSGIYFKQIVLTNVVHPIGYLATTLYMIQPANLVSSGDTRKHNFMCTDIG